MPLHTRNVFIDTEFFVKAGLDFSSKTLQSFKEICNEGELKHVTSTIVVKEVKRKIAEQIKEAISGVTEFRRKARTLRASENQAVKNLFIEFDQREIEDQAIGNFDEFLIKSKSKIVDLKRVDGNEIMEMYWDRKAPFINEKKKNEFRDAFSLLAVRSALRKQEKIYVVSEDADHIKFCEQNAQFVSVDTLSRLLDIYNAHHDERSAFIKTFLDDNVDYIKDAIREQIVSADAYNASSWEDSEIENFSILEVSDFEPSIVQIDDQGCQIVFDIDLMYTVTVTGPDYANGTYDKEEGVTYTFEDTTREEQGDMSFPVEIDLTYEIDQGDFINEEMKVNVLGISGGIEFSVEEAPGYEHY